MINQTLGSNGDNKIIVRIFLIMVGLLIMGIVLWELRAERFIEDGCTQVIKDKITIPTLWRCPQLNLFS
jgi:transposase